MLCVLTVLLTSCSSVSLPLPRPPYSLGHNNSSFKPINPTVASKCSIERKGCTSLPLNQKLEMIRLSKESILKTKIGQKPCFLYQTVSQVGKAKEKFFKKIKSALPVNKQMIRKPNSHIPVWRRS